MKRPFQLWHSNLVASFLVFGLPCPGLAEAELAFEGAAGFGALSKGGKSGRIIEVTRLDDKADAPEPGSFRWAVSQSGPRIVKFRVAGTIELEDTVVVREPFLTIDGSDAPGLGICLRGGALEFENTHDIVVRYIRVRLGDEATLRKNRERRRKRPENSKGLDCIGLSGCRDVIIDHVSASWSCDELFSIVRSRNVTVQWCLPVFGPIRMTGPRFGSVIQRGGRRS